MKLRNELYRRVCERVFKLRILDNAARGHIAEELVLMALEPEWELCSGGWHAWDLENSNHVRIQVRQSAALQTWQSKSLSSREFTFAPATGYYDRDGNWVDSHGRHADIYVFAWHSETEPEIADQLNPEQWAFFAVREKDLPDQKSMRISVAKRLWEPCSHSQLADKISQVVAELA